MSTLSDVVDRYLQIWNETDDDARRKGIEEVWSPDGSYTDPLVTVSGRDGFDRVIAGAQSQFAGLSFEKGSTYQEHHNVARFTWHLVAAPGTEPIAVGFDVAVLDDAGRISAVYGFIDKMPG